MKIKNKALLSVALPSILFLISGAVLLMARVSPWWTLALSAASSVAIFLLTQKLIVQRIEKFDAELRKNNSTIIAPMEPLQIDGNDDVSSMIGYLNKLLNNTRLFYESVEEKITIDMDNIKNQNIELKEQISARLRTEKMLATDNIVTSNNNPSVFNNGVFFNEILNKAINYSYRRKQILAVLLIDIDSFETVSQSIGEQNAQLVLKELTDRFTRTLRKEDLLSKLDGNEFIVLLNDINKPKFASMVAEKLLHACAQIFKIDHQEFSLNASIGISIYPNDGLSLEELIENANKALFKAQQSGGQRYQFHIHELHTEAMEYIQLESALRKAIQNNELTLNYQPKFRVKTGNIAGVEALMRWEHPTLGIINPVKFIELAEESGLVMQIAEWAFKEAIQRIKYWQNEGYEHLTVALKISQKQFYHPDFIKTLKQVVDSIEINPRFIELEISEKAVMSDINAATTILSTLKDIGPQITLDHFGTGYTSISYLKHLPINSIKIDKSYVKGIPNSPDDNAITSAIIALAHTLGLQVIAEGVENAEQTQYLSSQNCDLIQGYFLGHPVSAQKIVSQFKKLQDEVLI